MFNHFDLHILKKAIIFALPSDFPYTDKSLTAFAKSFNKCIAHIKSTDVIPEKFRIDNAQFAIFANQTLSNATLIKNSHIEVFDRVHNSTYVATNIASSCRVSSFPYQYNFTKFSKVIIESYYTLESFQARTIRSNDYIKKNIKTLTNKQFEQKLINKTFLPINATAMKAITAYASNELSKVQDYRDVSWAAYTFRSIKFHHKGIFYIELGPNEAADLFLDGIKNAREFTFLSNIPRKIRSIILSGYVGKDISCGIFAMMFNVIYTASNTALFHALIKRDFPILGKMFDKKITFRNYLGAKLGIKSDDAKMCMTALATNPNFDIKHFLYNKPNSKYNKKLINTIIDEVRELHNRVHDILANSDDPVMLFNFMKSDVANKLIKEDIERARIETPKRFGRGKHIAPKAMARLYMIFEHRMRTVMMKVLKSSYQVHDCVYTTMNVSNAYVEKMLFNETGCHVPISQ